MIAVGAGGGLQFQYPEMHSAAAARGPTRLVAFALEGDRALPESTVVERALPAQPKLAADEETVALGKALYTGYCKICHGSGAIARFGGSVPDLRFASAATFEIWDAIVVGGSKADGGMPAMEISIEHSQAIRAYVLSRAAALRAENTCMDLKECDDASVD